MKLRTAENLRTSELINHSSLHPSDLAEKTWFLYKKTSAITCQRPKNEGTRAGALGCGYMAVLIYIVNFLPSGPMALFKEIRNAAL